MFLCCEQVTSYAAEHFSAIHWPKKARYFLLYHGHADVIFTTVVSEGNLRIYHEQENIVFKSRNLSNKLSSLDFLTRPRLNAYKIHSVYCTSIRVGGERFFRLSLTLKKVRSTAWWVASFTQACDRLLKKSGAWCAWDVILFGFNVDAFFAYLK